MIDEIDNTVTYDGSTASTESPYSYNIPFRFDKTEWIHLQVNPPLPVGTELVHAFSEPRSEWLERKGKLVVKTDLTNRTLTIARRVPAVQLLDLVPNSPLPAEDLEKTLDHMAMALQDRGANHADNEAWFLRQANMGIKVGNIFPNEVGAGSITLQALRTTNTNAAYGREAIAIGDSRAGGEGSFAAGRRNTSSGYGSISLGTENEAGARDTVSVGSRCEVSQEESSAFGYGNTISGAGTGSTAVGTGNQSVGDACTSIGKGNISNGQRTLFAGLDNIHTHAGNESMAIGLRNKASGDENVIVGRDNMSLRHSVVYGRENKAYGYLNTVVGHQNEALGYQSVVCGFYNRASLTGSTAVGLGNSSMANDASSFGRGNSAAAKQSLAVGYWNLVTGVSKESVAMGSNNTINSAGVSVAVGTRNTIHGAYSSSMGISNTVTGQKSAAFGYKQTVGADHVTEMGNQSPYAAARIRANGNNGVVQISYGYELPAPVASTAAHGLETDAQLPARMLGFRVTGSTFHIDLNVVGTVRTISLPIP